MFDEVGPVSVVTTHFPLHAFAGNEPPLPVSDTDGIDFRNALFQHEQQFCHGSIAHTGSGWGFKRVDGTKQCQVDLAYGADNVGFEQYGKIDRAVARGGNIAIMAQLQAVNADANDQGIDQQDRSNKPAPEVRACCADVRVLV